MKKIKFISALALTMVLASCDNFDLPNPPGQTNPEPDGVFENSGLVLTQGENAFDLKTYNQANKDVNVANVTELINFPEGYDLSIDMEVAPDANSFDKADTIGTTVVDNAVMANPDFLNGAIQECLTKKPGEYNIAARFVAYAERGTTRMRLGGIDATYCPSEFKVTTLDPAKVMEDSYYLVPCTGGKPQASKAIKMQNTGGDVSVYDNPVFAIKFDVTEQESIDGYEWVVLPASSIEAGNTDGMLGCIASEDNELEGKLGLGYEPGKIHLMGSVLVTINVEQESYIVNYAFDVLYPFSGVTAANKVLRLYTTDYINYSGVTIINRQWTLGAQPDKTGPVIFKQDPNSEQEVSEDGYQATGKLTPLSDGTRISAPIQANSLYWAEVNLVQLTYTIYGIQAISVIGSGNGWDVATATQLTPSKDLKVWTAKDVEIGDEFKLNCNSAWTVAFSGTQISDMNGTIVYNVNKQDGGDNLKATPGKYDVEINFSEFPYTVTLVKK